MMDSKIFQHFHTKLSLDNICRICLKTEENCTTNLFSDDVVSKDILNKIYLCYHIVLNHNSNLPSMMCQNCIKELHCAEQFRIKCVTFEERFRKLKITNINTKTGNCLDAILEESLCDDYKNLSSLDDNVKPICYKFQCNVCNKVLKSKLSLSKHIITMHQNRKHVGRITGHGVNKRYHCTKCSYSTTYSQTLTNHMRRHNGERPYHCYCGKTFTQSASLATHQKTHSNVKSHICSTCGKQFSHAFSLKKHLLVHATAQFTCKICQKSLKTEYSLDAHINRHYNIRNYSCEECGDTFVTSTDLLNHRKRHSSEMKAECHLCDYKTRAKKNLIVHLKRHAGDKKFVCEICNKALYTQADLRRHLRVHSREKPYPCPACAQRFSQPGSLNHHVRNLHAIPDFKWSRIQTFKSPGIKQKKKKDVDETK